jgi:hypothetical protein
VEFTHRFYIAQGIGQADYANDHVAVGIDGQAFAMISPRPGEAKVTDGSGKTVAQGPVGPHAKLQGEFDGKRLIVSIDGRQVMDRTFPLPRPKPARDTPVPAEVRKAYDKLVAPDPQRFEKECFGRNEGMPGVLGAIRAAKKIANGADKAFVTSLARSLFRLGRLQEAERLAKLAPGPQADYVRGLIAWEKGAQVDFGQAGWEADYMRALLAIQNGDKAKAVKLAESYIEHVPTAWRPRLAKACWSGDKAAAKALAAENPGSPEAQLVLKLLGEDHELKALLRNNPSADHHVKLFEAALMEGKWEHLPRYPSSP